MAQKFLQDRQGFKDNIERLSTTIPGYAQLARGIKGDVRMVHIDFPTEGPGRRSLAVNAETLAHPIALYGWLTKKDGLEMRNITTRYVLVEDIDTEIIYTLGATFGLEPQFFLDHMNNQISSLGSTLGKSDQRIQWNTWNLKKPYMSFHWYRPVSRNSVNGPVRRERVERRYETVDSQGKKHFYTIIRAASSILRPEWDILGSGVVGEEDLVAIDERVSICNVKLDGYQYGELGIGAPSMISVWYF
jgi:hypothetical protein